MAFYTLLGFERVQTPPGIGARATWLALGPTQLHLMPTAEERPGSGHVGVVVGDFATTVAALEAAGHAVEPRRRHWGAARCYVHDPAGNLVELMERPPA